MDDISSMLTGNIDNFEEEKITNPSFYDEFHE